MTMENIFSVNQKIALVYILIYMESGIRKTAAYKSSIAPGGKSGLSLGFSQTDFINNSSPKVSKTLDMMIETANRKGDVIIKDFLKRVKSHNMTTEDINRFGKNGCYSILFMNEISYDSAIKDRLDSLDVDNINTSYTNVYKTMLNIISFINNGNKNVLSEKIFSNGKLLDNQDTYKVLGALAEWSNQSGGLDTTGDVNSEDGLYKYLCKNNKKLDGDTIFDYVFTKYYFNGGSGNPSSWENNVNTSSKEITNYINTYGTKNFNNNTSLKDIFISYIIPKAHADTILTPEEKLRLHLKHAQKQRDPLVISRDTYPNLMSNQFSDIYSPLATGIEGRTGWVGDDTSFLMRKTTDGYQDLVWGDLAVYADKNGLITITDYPDTFYIWDGASTYTEASAFGITSINTVTDPDFLPYSIYGNTILNTSPYAVTYTDGTTGSLSQVSLSISKTYTMLDIDKTTDTSSVSDLPNLKGYGVLPSTRTAMTLYSEMATAVRTMLSRPDMSYTTLFSDFLEVMNLWQSQYTLSGTEDIPDGDFLAFIYKYLGEVAPFSGRNSISYYGAPSRYILNDIYDYISKILLAKTIIQCSLGTAFLQWFQYDAENDAIVAQSSSDDILTEAKAALNLDTTTTQGELNFKILGILLLASAHADIMMDASIYIAMNQVDADIAERMTWFAQNTNVVEDADTINVEQSNFGGKVYPWSAQKDMHLIWNKSQGFQIDTPDLDVLALNCLPDAATITRVKDTLLVSVGDKTLTIDLPGAANLGAVIFSDSTNYLSVAPFDINPLYLVIGDTTLIQGDCYLNDGMNILVSRASLSYNFLFDTTLDVGPNNCTLILEHADTLSISDITQVDDTTFSISKDDYTLTIKTEDGIVTLQQNGATLCFLGTGIMQNPATPNQWQTITIPVEAPGIYAYQKQNLVTFDISKHSGKDVILLDGYSGRAFLDINYAGASDTTRYLQTSPDEITITDGDQTIVLANAMWSSLTSSFPTDIRNMTNKKGVMTDRNSFIFDMALAGGVLTTGFYGTFAGQADSTVSDIIFIKGTKSTVDITEEHDTFFEVENNDSVKNPPRTYPTINVALATSGCDASAKYTNGNVVITCKGKTYTIVDADNTDDWGLYTINFKYGSSVLASYSNNVGNIPLEYSQNGTDDLIFKTINANNIIQINGSSGTISGDVNATHNIYKVNNGGDFIINVSASTADIYPNSMANLTINNMTSGNIHLTENMAQWINDGYDLIGISATGKKLVIKNYMTSGKSINIRVNEASLPTSQTTSYLQDYTAQVPAYIKTWNVYLSQSLSGSLTDHMGMKTSVYDTSSEGNQVLSISGALTLSPQGNGTISITLTTQDSTLTLPATTGTISDISLSQNTLSFKVSASGKVSNIMVDNLLWSDANNLVVSKLITGNKAFAGLLTYLSDNKTLAIDELVYTD